jgi:hypothetical protein
MYRLARARKTSRLRALFLAGLCLGSGLAARSAVDDADFAAVRQADRQRVAATIAGDISRLSDLLSHDLRYMDASDRVQTKDQFVASVASSKVEYLSVTPRGVAFQAIAPGAVAMSGRTQIVARANGQRVTFGLRFLAIWRDEGGHWRLLAYQSASLATPESAGSK